MSDLQTSSKIATNSPTKGRKGIKSTAVITPSPKVKKGAIELSSPLTSNLISDELEKENVVSDEEHNSRGEGVHSNNTVSIKKASTKIDPSVSFVYKILNKATGSLGGNGYMGAIYGELTIHSMQKIVNVLMDHCDFTHRSRFIDIGSGLGKPNFHVSQNPGVRLSLGIELEDIRWRLSIHNLSAVLHHMSDPLKQCSTPAVSSALPATNLRGGNVNFIVGDIDSCSSIDPFTHIYQFDLGFPPPLQKSIASKFNHSKYARYLVSYRPPHRVIREYGFAVERVTQMATSMFGEGHTAYFYRRVDSATVAAAKLGDNITNSDAQVSVEVLLPARFDFNEEEETVTCDPVFAPHIVAAVGSLQTFIASISAMQQQHMECGRPTRACAGRDKRAETEASVKIGSTGKINSSGSGTSSSKSTSKSTSKASSTRNKSASSSAVKARAAGL